MTQAEWNADFATRLMHNEGFRRYAYRDSLGHLTIGCGFLLERPDWQQGLEAAGVPADECANVANGSRALSTAEVIALLNYSDEPIIPQARAELEPSHFDNMSDARRCAFADLDFNLGQGGLDQFIGFRGLMDQACHYMQTGDPATGHAVCAAADPTATVRQPERSTAANVRKANLSMELSP